MNPHVDVGSADSIPEGGRRVVFTPREAVVVFRRGDQYFALKNACPHRAEPLHTGSLEGETVTCPGHAWKINIRTGATDHELCARTYVVEVRDGRLILDTEGPSDP